MLDRAASGDVAAASDLLAGHRLPWRGFVDLHLDAALRAWVDPSDVVQEAHADMARQLSDYLARRPMPFHLWARKAVYNRLVNARPGPPRRSPRRAGGGGTGPVVAGPGSVDHRPGPVTERGGGGSGGGRRVAAAVEGLDPADREVLLMRQVDRLPYEEAACLLGVTAEAARQRGTARGPIRLRRAQRARFQRGAP
ncbi:MAG: sigma factor-like helix-turn-helix DNA-binding protein [Gemmataceae bacterium]